MEFAAIVAENVLGRLASYASQEVCLAWGAQLELSKLTETLTTISLVLQDAEKKQVKNPLIAHWLGKLKDVCYDVDDILDEVEYQKQRKKVLIHNHGRVKGQVHHFFSPWNSVFTDFNLGHKVKAIRERLDEVNREKTEFSLAEVSNIPQDHSVPQGLLSNPRETDSLVKASVVIGRDHDKEQILNHLLHNTEISSEEENVAVISILGMGGLGKTTLTKLVYNDRMVEEHFEVRMWVCVSDSFEVKALVLKIINAATDQKCEDESLDRLKRRLQETVRDKKFLLVLDDVWDTESVGVTPEKWLGLRSVLCVGANGSRILVTTRNESVALLVKSTYMHSLEGLPHKDCMSLFIQRAFNKGEEQQYPHLKEIGEEIVKKCGGVPLAVATLGSMLQLNRDSQHWLSVRDDDMWCIGNKDILPALRLSYDALPQYLKPCFAYCSLFPKDFEFDSESLVEQWIAQGYLKTSKKNDDLHLMGMAYVREFCSRSLFQVNIDAKTIMMFTMHDLVHDVAILVAQKEYSTVNLRPHTTLKMVRHVSVSAKDLIEEEKAQVPEFMFHSTKLRTFLIPKDGKVNQHFVKTCTSRFKYMRVLDFSGSPLQKLPRSIGSLFHLRHLDLSKNREIKRLPNSICELLNLETLDLYGCVALEKIPEDIGNLINLRSLTVTSQQKFLPKGISRLTSLQLLYFDECANLKSLGAEIQCLTNLRKLLISECESLESLPPNMKLFTVLNTLMISECEKLDLMKTIEGPQGLKSICFIYLDLKALPPWLEDSAKALQSIRVKDCENLTEFPELQQFTSLEQLQIDNCSNLLAFPQGWHSLTKLKELEIEDCPKLSKNCRRQVKAVDDWSKFARDRKIIVDDSEEDTDEEEDEDGGPPHHGADDDEGAHEGHNAISCDN